MEEKIKLFILSMITFFILAVGYHVYESFNTLKTQIEERYNEYEKVNRIDIK